MNYVHQCNKYFAPLDEIAEAVINNEGLNGLSNDELLNLISSNTELDSDLCKYQS